MSSASSSFTPGSLVRARGREWIVLNGSSAEVLRVRPLSGSEEDQTLIHIDLELDGIDEARFPVPTLEQKASHDAALLLRDALLLSLRRGAGPFRSFGQISVEPRAYQLVPLLMAMKLDPIRLLIADDVGIGKTIEAGLIARELLDRGEIARTVVLCPPHLVDQWIHELTVHFHIRPVAVTATSASRLERNLPPQASIFSTYPHTVVSLDYIKNDSRRGEFLRVCPEFVIVDEAHTCTGAGRGRHQRYDLLKGLTESPTRHFVMLTATPHSGDEEAFYRLLGLLEREFQFLQDATTEQRTALRDRLSNYFVQRRRVDIAEWQETDLFPRRETKEVTYTLAGKWEKFFTAVLDYCAALVESAEGDESKQRLNFWGTLALMRCVGSSPGAALQALRTQAGLDKLDIEALEARVFDGDSDTLPDDDAEPAAGSDDPALAELITQASALTGHSGDPKLKVLLEQLDELVTDGFRPVVFCRYIATAHYLRSHVAQKFKAARVDAVTGESTADERRRVIESRGEDDQDSARILIATDCLSEGINLQDYFDAVVHYDLSWNPTRHEQREGRVDRYRQPSKVVRAVLIYGVNNPVDGAVLEVILRKAAKIREELGVPVPLPDEGHSLTQALLKAVLLKRGHEVQGKQLKLFDQTWEDVASKAKKNRTVFAQRRLKPEDVLPEWHKSLAAIGSAAEVERFTSRALARFGAGLERLKAGGFRAPLDGLPVELRERLEAEGLRGTLLVDFSARPRSGVRRILRSHPLVSVVAENLLERTLEAAEVGDASVLGRVGCWTADVKSRTVVALLRLRHQLTQRGRTESTLLVEEASALAWVGKQALEGHDALGLLELPPTDPPAHVRERAMNQALGALDTRNTDIEAFAQRRAQALLADHRRVRQAADARGSYTVKSMLPVDVIGLYVLLPPTD